MEMTEAVLASARTPNLSPLGAALAQTLGEINGAGLVCKAGAGPINQSGSGGSHATQNWRPSGAAPFGQSGVSP